MQEEIKEIFNINELFEEWKQFLSWCYENNDKTVEIHRDKLKFVMDYITNLQEEKIKKITNLEYKIERLEEENKQLKELCNKYEEEHKTTFEEWKKDIKANKKAIEYTNKFINYKTSRIDEWKNVELVLETIVDILRGDNK